MARHLGPALIAGPDDRRSSFAPPGDQRLHHLEPYQRLVPKKDESGILLFVSSGLERGKAKAQRAGEAQRGRRVDDAVEARAAGKAQSPLILGSNHNIRGVEQSTFVCGYSYVEHVGQ
jgi:hypothetical protein